MVLYKQDLERQYSGGINRNVEESTLSINYLPMPQNNFYRYINPIDLSSSPYIPLAHKKAAAQFILMRKVYGTPVIYHELTQDELMTLKQCHFNILRKTTSSTMVAELCYLQKLSESQNPQLKELSDFIIHIRCKELKNLFASNFVNLNKRLYDGYQALERYFKAIAKNN